MATVVEPVAGVRVETFEGFFDEHSERLLRVMYPATGDRHEAETLAQEALNGHRVPGDLAILHAERNE
jgi:hypothetical protein